MTTPYAPPPDWYPDPSGGSYLRYWDGTAWSSHTRPMGMTAPAAPAYGYPGQAAAVMPSVPQGYAGYGTAGMPQPTGSWRGPVDDRPLVRNIFDAVRVCFQKYAQFNGRAGRAEFWYAELTLFLAYFLFFFVLVFAFVLPMFGVLLTLVLWAGGLACYIPLLAVAIRRLRDAGFHWAWIFIAFIPFGSIALIIMWAQPSKYP